MAGRRSQVEDAFPDFIAVIRDQKLLYVSLARVGIREKFWTLVSDVAR